HVRVIHCGGRAQSLAPQPVPHCPHHGGIAVGVAAVITIVALGTGAQTAIEDACRRIISTSLTQFLEWPTDIPSSAALGSFAFAAFIGIFFGWYPARRAAEIDPIDALRFE